MVQDGLDAVTDVELCYVKVRAESIGRAGWRTRGMKADPDSRLCLEVLGESRQ